ncbi:MAG: hypothetical protein COB04_07180 [Gammaproteobacteria bacterium]|nr:MAG: hypothetical protein COB04_07180 [Gammaproteobacteria bacterium]
MSNTTGNVVKYGLIAAVVGGMLYYGGESNNSTTQEEIDLNAVLDITVDTLYSFDEGLQGQQQYQSDYQDSYQDDYAAQAPADDTTLASESASEPSSADAASSAKDDAIMADFSRTLQDNLNAAHPALYPTALGVVPRSDASLLAFDDANGSQSYDEDETKLFIIEIDGENSRIVASSRSGAVNDHHFSGTSLLTGYLIGSMLARQRLAGVNPSRLANKKPATAKTAAKARAGSGSHSKGK